MKTCAIPQLLVLFAVCMLATAAQTVKLPTPERVLADMAADDEEPRIQAQARHRLEKNGWIFIVRDPSYSYLYKPSLTKVAGEYRDVWTANVAPNGNQARTLERFHCSAHEVTGLEYLRYDPTGKLIYNSDNRRFNTYVSFSELPKETARLYSALEQIVCN